LNSFAGSRKTNWFAVWLDVVGAAVILTTEYMSYSRHRHLAILLGDQSPIMSYLHLNWYSIIFPFFAILVMASGVYLEIKKTTAAIVVNLLPSIAILIIFGISALHFKKMDGESRAVFVVLSTFLITYAIAMVVSYLIVLRSNRHHANTA
jgi:hypothetical protein